MAGKDDEFAIEFDLNEGMCFCTCVWVVYGGVVHYAEREDSTGKTETVCGIKDFQTRKTKGDKSDTTIRRLCKDCAEQFEVVEGQVCEQ